MNDLSLPNWGAYRTSTHPNAPILCRIHDKWFFLENESGKIGGRKCQHVLSREDIENLPPESFGCNKCSKSYASPEPFEAKKITNEDHGKSQSVEQETRQRKEGLGAATGFWNPHSRVKPRGKKGGI